MATRQQVVDEARTWLGTRWAHQANIKGVGVDCLQLVILVALSLGLIDKRDFERFYTPEFSGYGRSPNGRLLLQGCNTFLSEIPYSDIQPGDVIIFKFVEEPQHFAIVTQINPPYILHAYAQARKVVEHRLDGAWEQRIVTCFRFNSLEE